MERDVVLVHVPKTGGTSLERGLEEAAGRSGGRWKFYSTPNHWTPDQWRISLGLRRYGDALKVICCRNPYTRAVSVWQHGRKRHRYMADGGTFDVFCRGLDDALEGAGVPAELYPQWRWWANVGEMKTYGIVFERLQEGWKALLKLMKVSFAPLPRLNVGRYAGRNYEAMRKMYTVECYEVIDRIYGKDFMLWNKRMGNEKDSKGAGEDGGKGHNMGPGPGGKR